MTESPSDDEVVGEASYFDLTSIARAQGLDELARRLERTERNRQARLFFVLEDPRIARGLEDGFRQLGLVSDFLASSHRLSGAMQLADRAISRFEEAIEALLAGNHGPLSASARELMEIEWLVRDFAYEPARLDEWCHSDARERLKSYSPAQLRKRLARHECPGKQLPETFEYQVHSEATHVTPDHGGPMQGREFTHDHSPPHLMFWLGEVLEHLRRVIIAFDRLMKLDGRPAPDWRRANHLIDATGLTHDLVDQFSSQMPRSLPPRGPIPPGARPEDYLPPVTNRAQRRAANRQTGRKGQKIQG